MTKIYYAGIQDHSTLDYPGKMAAVVYLCGCTYRCPWCQNRDLVMENPQYCKEETLDVIIKKLKENFIIDAAVISGGEPLIQKETIELVDRIGKETNLLRNVNTNGSSPAMLEKVLPMLDFVTMDLKAPMDERYGQTIGIPEEKQYQPILEKVEKTLQQLGEWEKEKEARTTIVPGLVDSKEDIEDIVPMVRKGGFSQYTIQQFQPNNTLDPGYMRKASPTTDEMKELGRHAKEFLPDVEVQIVSQETGFVSV